jgi:DNA polymerase-3 subunit beta
MTTCNATDLTKALRLLKPLIWAKGSIPILKCVHLSAQDGHLSITATDLDAEMTTTIEASGDLSPCVLPHADLMAVLKGVKGNVTLAEDGAFTAEGTTAQLTPLSVEDWPSMFMGKETAPAATWPCDGAVFRSALELASRAMSSEETRYYLRGVFFDPPRPGCPARMVATDGHVLAYHALPEDYPDTAPESILPRESVALALAAIPAKGVPPVHVQFYPSRMTITCGEAVIRSKLIDGTFPDYRRVVPAQDNAMHIDLAAGDVQRIKILATRDQARVIIDPANGTATHTLRTLALIPGTGQPFGVSGILLHRLLGSEDATLSNNDKRGDPIRVTWPHRPEALGVIMSMTI